MRSYREHVETLLDPQTKPLVRRPTFRSSAIFPVILSEGIRCRLLFLGYWALKRDIPTITLVATLRDQTGTTIYRHVESIREPKTYRIELQDMFSIGLSDFEGSIEVEFFSGQDLVFPYPAVVINYYGDHFNTVVHTAQRVYNDHEDWRTNSQTVVPESGFNLYADLDREPFIALVNGPQAVQRQTIMLTVYNYLQEKTTIEFPMEGLNPYETVALYPARQMDLARFLDGQVGTAKVQFEVAWIYPRLLVGNVQKALPAMSVTHTYYDCSSAENNNDYWLESDPAWNDASLMVPVKADKDRFTKVYFYPIYSPSHVDIDVELYNASGHRLGVCAEVMKLSSPGPTFGAVDMGSLCAKLDIDTAQPLTARVIAHRHADSSFPARIKLGLDQGHLQGSFPCNICTNLHPYNPSLESKPHCFRWLPIFSEGVIWLLNSSPAKRYTREAVVDLSFFREQDTQKLERTVTIPAHGFIVIEPAQNMELKAFLQNSIGWCTAKSSNPYLSTYYFVENESGVIGGDHGF